MVDEPTPEVSVVVPVYGCKDCLEALSKKLIYVLEQLSEPYEIVYVDDGSPDGAWRVIVNLAHTNASVRGFRLSRNFGQHAAITAGIAQARGSWVVVMDCDLQDPPELIPDLLNKAKQGFDIVYARRISRRQGKMRILAAKLYFAALRYFNRGKIDGDLGSFSVLSRKVANAFLSLQDRNRHYVLVLQWLGFDSAYIGYDPKPRFSGKTAYSLRSLMRHAFDGMFFQTTVLLRWIVYLGFSVSMTGFLLAAFFIYAYFTENVYPGWTSLAVLILVIGGFVITSTGIAGLYIGQIFEQVKGRPLYIIDETVKQSRE